MYKNIISTIILGLMCAPTAEASTMAHIREQARKQATAAADEADAATAEADRTSGAVNPADFDAPASARARSRARNAAGRAAELSDAMPGTVAPAVRGRAVSASRRAELHAEVAGHGAAAVEAARLAGAQVALAGAGIVEDKFNAFDEAFRQTRAAVAARGPAAAPRSAVAAAATVEAKAHLVNVAELAAAAAEADIAGISAGMVRDRAVMGEADAMRNTSRVQALRILLNTLVTGGVGTVRNPNPTVARALATVNPALNECNLTIRHAQAGHRP